MPQAAAEPAAAFLLFRNLQWGSRVGGLIAPDKYAMRVTMDKDRIEGAAEQAKGKIKEVAGKVTGDFKLETEGKADQVAGKIKNTVGGIKDTIKQAADD